MFWVVFALYEKWKDVLWIVFLFPLPMIKRSNKMHSFTPRMNIHTSGKVFWIMSRAMTHGNFGIALPKTFTTKNCSQNCPFNLFRSNISQHSNALCVDSLYGMMALMQHYEYFCVCLKSKSIGNFLEHQTKGGALNTKPVSCPSNKWFINCTLLHIII